MITALDFGCDSIRSAYRNTGRSNSLTLGIQRAEYVALPIDESFIGLFEANGIPFAECENSLVVYGNYAEQVRWLGRIPPTPLLTEGAVPANDPPARQILNLLTEAILPEPTSPDGVCCFTSPPGDSNTAFLSRLIRMQGWEPLYCDPATAVTLATGLENRYSGLTVVFGSEHTHLRLTQFGRELGRKTLGVGAAWIDHELATQCDMKVWDAKGDCYLDVAEARSWKQDPRIHLRRGTGEREKTLARLYGTVLNRIARAARELVLSAAGEINERIPISFAGGACLIGGFPSLMMERLVEHAVSERFTTLRVVDDAHLAVVRGLLINAELEQQASIEKVA